MPIKTQSKTPVKKRVATPKKISSGNTLLIVESPSKATTIQKYLGNEYTVLASIGHIRDLPTSQKKALDIAGGFIPNYEISKGKDKVVRELQKAAESASQILLAPDPDREGEAIAWHLSEILKEDTKITAPVARVTFNEITQSAILRALETPREIDMDLKSAQEARRVLDRLFGYDLSALIWKKVRYGLSAGRVQSPALRIIMEREREIRAFIPETYFVLSADLGTTQKESYTFICIKEPSTKEESDAILEKGKIENWKIHTITSREEKRSPRAPFTTSTLQQAGSSRLGYSPKRTMQLAQKLYEKGFITYMRTDSTSLSKDFLGKTGNYIDKTFGEQYCEIRVFKTKSKNAQEAHEAIRPTDISKKSAGFTDEEKRVYSLIWERTLASQMADARLKKTRVEASTFSDSIPRFSLTGSITLFDGWLQLVGDASERDTEIPKLWAENSALVLHDIRSEEKQTTPPNRYSEAGLIKELEARGIGRPSTYASIISTLEEREYVEKVNKALHPTKTGEVVSGFLETHFEKYISDSFTAKMEDELDNISAGKATYLATLTDFYTPFTKDVTAKESVEKATNLGVASAEFSCPKCGSGMVIKLGRGGTFLSCATYPACDGALMEDGTEIKKDEAIGIDPETQMPIFVLVGRFGPYVQLGEKSTDKKAPKPKMASIPKGKDVGSVTVADALTYLALPRTLGTHPEDKKPIIASIGRFGPYIGHDKDFRSLKTDDPYTIDLSRALEILAIPKKPSRFTRKKSS